MKKIYLLIGSLLIAIALQAQVVKIIENTAGKLDSLLTKEELSTVTDLTMTGTMDVRDFTTIRHNLYFLEHLDLSGVSVVAYTGMGATGETTVFEANVIPEYGIYNKENLVDIKLPPHITEIKDYAFQRCNALTTINVPSFVSRIGNSAFSECGRLSSVILPSSLTYLGSWVFYECASLTLITIPSSVTTIGSYAFYQCTALTDIAIPSSVSVIAPGTYSYCSSLTTVNIPASVILIGPSAFSECSALTSIQISSSVTEIGNAAFSSCGALTSIIIPPSVTSIGCAAFSSCTSLRSINLPSSISFIRSEAFKSCISLTSFIIPPAVTDIDAGVFKGCTSLSSVTIPPAVKSIGAEAFSGCSALASIDIPSSVTAIGTEAFLGCNALTTLTLPPSVLTIGDSAIGQCENLTSLTLPASVNFIGSFAFGNCPKLTTLYANKSVPVENGENYFYMLDKSKCTLHVPYGSAAFYAAANEWKDFILVEDSIGLNVPVNFIKFDQGADEFQFTIHSNTAWQASTDQPWLKVSPASGTTNTILTVNAEANGTFTNRYGIIFITDEKGQSQRINVTQKSNPEVIPVTADHLQYILTQDEIDTIKSLNLTGTIDERDISFIVDKMPMLTQLDMSKTTITTMYGIPTNWLPGPTVDSYRIPDSEVCGGILHKPLLTRLLLPSTLEVIGCEGLSGCIGLSSILIPPSVKKIGESAFRRCIGLTSIDIPSSVIYLSKMAFEGCSGLKEVRIGNGIQELRERTFENCTSLTSVTLPDSLKAIEKFVFNESPNLAFIYSYNTEPPFLDFYLSMNRVNKATCMVYVPLGAGSAYAKAEGWKEFNHIEEILPGLNVSSNSVSIKASQSSTATATIIANVAWIASSDQSWLTVNPSSGADTQQITFTADANTSSSGRVAKVTFTATGIGTRTITVIQEIAGKTIHLTAGTLSSILTAEELTGLTNLTLTGTIDARDFRTMRDKMPLLSTLDLRETTITAWSDKNYYAAHSIPPLAFDRKSNLTSVLLPKSVTVINAGAFSNCTGLTTLKIPSTVTVIDYGAFNDCTSLDTLFCFPVAPPELIAQVSPFHNINKASCMLLVPFGSRDEYAKTIFFQDFDIITEGLPALDVSTRTVVLKDGRGTVLVNSDDVWKASSGQSWLTVNPASGSSSSVLTFSAVANSSGMGRMTEVLVSASDYATQAITVIQEGLHRSLNLTPGTLSTVLTTEELSGTTHLTITGRMDVRDFKTMRDQMPLLSFLDLSKAKIAAYSGEGGTSVNYTIYSANEVPPEAFYNKSTLMGKNSLTSIQLPDSIINIDIQAFNHCNGLTAFTMPRSLIKMATNILDYSLYVDTINIYAYPPITNEQIRFFHNIKSTSKVYVPYGYKIFYSQAAGWNTLTNIVEMPGFRISTGTIAVKTDQGSTAIATLASNMAWTASSDQSWLTVSPPAGSDSQVLTFTADANPSGFGRMATVIILAGNIEPQTITVIQEGKPKSLNFTAGTLSTALTKEEMNGITSLTITGDMDARDFKTMRDLMPLLTKVDLSKAHIKSYGGYEGTINPYFNYNVHYNEDEIPVFAFFYSFPKKGKSNLTSIVLPHTVKRIETAAFSHCTGLTSFKIPASVNYINMEAFDYCVNLDSLYIYAMIPPELYDYQEAFFNVNKDTVKFFIPYGSRELYSQQDQWKDFKNTLEMPGFSLPTSTVTINAKQGSTTSILIDSNISWTASSGQSWLVINPFSAAGTQKISFTSEANPSPFGREATVTVSADGAESQTITVIQESIPKIVNLTAGTLSKVLTVKELQGITSLTITGEIDGRDFKTMRDQMPILSTVDLSEAKIVFYVERPGVDGEYYDRDVIPPYAFYHPYTKKGKSSLTSIRLPGSITGIQQFAFADCSGLTTFKIPESVTYIQDCAFLNNLHLDTIFSYAKIPPQLAGNSVFNNVRKTSSILYVPYGTKEPYSSAYYWKEFKNIVEMSDFDLSAQELIFEASSGKQIINITTDGKWSTICNNDWLEVKPAMGDSSQTITFTCLENHTSDTRITTVRFSSVNSYSQSITITQKGLVTALNEVQANAGIKYYPNPFTEQLSIEIANPSLKEVNVEIFSISGLKIKSLVKAQKGDKINCTWDGRDEKGRKMQNGMYILRINEIAKKVIVGNTAKD